MLITLAIVGVIAALTIPNLVSNVSNAQELTQLKKVYGDLNAAFMSVQYDNSGIESVFGNSMDNGSQSLNIFAAKMNVITNCGAGIGCWYNTSIKLYNGITIGLGNVTPDTTWNGSYGKAILADGTMIKMQNYSTSCTQNAGTGPLLNSVCANLFIDLNGSKDPNTIGKDCFAFWITKTGIQPYGSNGDSYSCGAGTSPSNSYGCTAKLLTGL